MYYGEFCTAYLQKENHLDCAVVTDSWLEVGALVVLSGNTIIPATGNDDDAALAQATHIIAQSDMTLGYGHVPVENRDYRYSNVVANTVGDSASDILGYADSDSDLSDFDTLAEVGSLVYVKDEDKLYECTTAATEDDPAIWAASTVVPYKKHVALYKIINKADVIPYGSES